MYQFVRTEIIMKGVVIMEINFTDQDILFIYGTFKKKIEKLNVLKSTPNCPIADDSINKEIELYTSVVNKLLEAQPKLAALEPYL